MKIKKIEHVGRRLVYNTNVEKNRNFICENSIVHKNCVVDEDYQGEIHIHLTNVGEETQVIKAGEKIIQFLLMPIVYEGLHEVMSEDELWEGEVTERGEGGFGSTGIH